MLLYKSKSICAWYHAAISLGEYTTILIYDNTAIRLNYYTSIPAHNIPIMLLQYDASVRVDYYTTILIKLYATKLLYNLHASACGVAV